VNSIIVAEGKMAARFDPAFACKESTLNIYDTKNEDTQPAMTKVEPPRYGMLTSNTNAGLRLPQSRPMNRDGFNSGCLNTFGCVRDAELGFQCQGSAHKPDPLTAAHFKAMAVSQGGGVEFTAPVSMMGIKSETINATNGWALTSHGKRIWQMEEPQIHDKC